MATNPLRREPDLETNTPPDELRREDQRETPPDSMPPRESGKEGDWPAGGGFTPAADGGNAEHSIHDEDEDGAEPSDYERELDRVATAARRRET